MLRIGTKFLPEDVLYSLSSGFGPGISWSTDQFGNATDAKQSQIDEAKRLYHLLTNVNSETQEKLRIPIDRWGKAGTEDNPVDKIIDLGIALEALYLPKGNVDQLSFQLRLHASLHLGKCKGDREKLMDEFKAIYTLRSKAVHNGAVPGKIRIRKGEERIATSELIPRAQDLCRQSIIKILEDGEFPDWNNLILG